ncbi:MAG: indole-3-glycerol phosphate synthase TrpC, partial [Chloroflexales bacterium]|nr:indole-3-glycerol phosphate synthase TrpC [Chloroflexales bacterium]
MSETVLSKILTHKRTEVERQKIKAPLNKLLPRVESAPAPRDFAAVLRKPSKIALIAEVKKASPSRGVLLENFDHLALARTYIANGAAALSVLTDVRFFQGSLKYLEGIRRSSATATPLLRKDFLIDSYQVYEARMYGADAVLLIVAALDDPMLRELLALTHSLGMHALVEVHTEAELERAMEAEARIIGVNNRNLHNFTTTLETTERLAALLPSGMDRPILVSESGIFTPTHVTRLRNCGADAVLIGEALVTALDIVARVRDAVPSEKPVTVKMRRGIDESNESRDRFFEIFDGAFALGIAAITVHGRSV